MARVRDVVQRDTRANQPLATLVDVGTLFYVTDESTTERSNGTIWETYADVSAAGGDVFGPGVSIDNQIDRFDGVTGKVIQTSLIQIIDDGESPEPSAPSDGDMWYNLIDDELKARINGVNVTLGAGSQNYTVGVTIDGEAAVPSTGQKGYRSIPVTGTIVSARLLADQVGDAVMDVWLDTFGNYPPIVADTITAAAKPTISSDDNSEDTTLTGWTTAVVAGDVLGFNLDSITTIQRITLELEIAP